MLPKLIAVDLDDTLLRTDLSISNYTKSVITLLRRCYGVQFCLASGRTLYALRHYVRFLELDHVLPDATDSVGNSFCICDNGARIIRNDTFETIFWRPLSVDVALAVFAAADSRGLPCQVYDNGCIYVSRLNEYAARDQQLTGQKQFLVSDFAQKLRQNGSSGGYSKIVIPGDPTVIAGFEHILANLLGNSAIVVTSKPYFLEVLTLDAGKGSALAELAKITGVCQQAVAAFGDAMNDESMLSWAGHSVAMCNGRPEIQAICHFVTDLDNDHDGVARYLESLFCTDCKKQDAQ